MYNQILTHPKIVTLTDLLPKLEYLKSNGKKIIFTNGCYDILHPGHLDLLTRAKTYGDILVLGLNSDNSVKQLGKDPDRPFNSFHIRAFVLAHLELIDFIIGFEEDTPLRLIEAIHPDVLVKGGDWCVEQIVGKEYVERNNGLVLSLPFLEGYSTSGLVQKIRNKKFSST